MFTGENITDKEFELLDCDNRLVAAFDTIGEATSYPRTEWLEPYRLRRSRAITERRHRSAMQWASKRKFLSLAYSNGYTADEAESAAENYLGSRDQTDAG